MKTTGTVKATGVVRRIDNLGRVVIPKDMRHALGVVEGDTLEIYANGNQLIIKKFNQGCYLCDSQDVETVPMFGHEICHKCVSQISEYSNRIKTAISTEK
ncbi:Transition state regulatory protein AbrB [compost metagenome]